MNVRRILLPFHVFDGGELELENHSGLFPLVKASGADGAEIRKERLLEDEWPDARSRADVYSVPAELFLKDGSINPVMVSAVQELKKIKAGALKVSLGHFDSRVFESSRLAEWILTFPEGTVLYVENDQTLHGGKIAALEAFFESVSGLGLPIGMAFDAGNWLYTGEDVLEAARRLGDCVAYIHLKETAMDGAERIAVPPQLGEGSIADKVLQQLPQDSPVGLEFPIASMGELTQYIQYYKGE